MTDYEKERKIDKLLILSYTIQQVVPVFVPKFKILGAVVPEKSLTKKKKNILEKKKNGQVKGMISMRMLILSYTMQVVLPNVCTKFQNYRCSSS